MPSTETADEGDFNMKKQGQSIVAGSLILLLANLLVKIIGAVFKIPLVSLLGNEGMGYFNAAYQIYAGLFVVATAGLPVAVSKMVSASTVQGNTKEVKNIFKCAYIMFIVIGIVGSCVLYFGADRLQSLTKYDNTANAIRTIAPAIFFVSLMSVYRGFFQGLSNMVPTAISEVTEAFAKLTVGYVCAYFLIKKSLPAAASGAIFGVTCGTVLSCAVLMLIYIKEKKNIYADMASSPDSPPLGKICAELIKIAIPVTISASVFTLTNMIDYALIGRNLNSIKDFLPASPTELYGMYTGKAVVLYNLPPTLIMALCMSLVPAVSRANALGNKQLISETATQSLKFTLMFSLPCCVGLFVLADPILRLLFPSNDAALLLKLLSPAVLFVSMVLVSNAVLQATGHVMTPVINIAAGGIFKVIINTQLVSNPSININGAPIGTTVCYFVYMLLNLIQIKKITNAQIGFSFWIKPFVSAVVMAVIAYALYGVLSPVLGGGKLMLAVLLVICGGISFVAYMLTLLTSGGISKDDISKMPKGDTILSILVKLKLVK